MGKEAKSCFDKVSRFFDSIETNFTSEASIQLIHLSDGARQMFLKSKILKSETDEEYSLDQAVSDFARKNSDSKIKNLKIKYLMMDQNETSALIKSLTDLRVT